MSREEVVRGPERQPLVEFASTFGFLSGLLGAGAAAIGVWLGLFGDRVLDQARAELLIAGLITAAAFVVLIGPWTKPYVRSIGMGAAAFTYHLFLSPWWLPWIENYSSVVGSGKRAQGLGGGSRPSASPHRRPHHDRLRDLPVPAEGRRSTSVR